MSRILLVDADPGERLIVRSRVTDLGHHVTTADTGAKGLVEARSSVFDLILLAQNLGGGVDGAEVCRRLKAMPQLNAVPIIIYSTHAPGPEASDRMYDSGCEAFVSKAQIPALDRVIAVLLRVKSRNDELNEQNRALEVENRRLDEERQRTADLEETACDGGPDSLVFRELAAGRPDGVLIVDSSGCVRHADRGACELLGAQIVAKNLGSLAPASGLEAFVRDARTAPREGFRFDVSARKDRTRRSLMASVLPLNVCEPGEPSGQRVVLLLDAGKRRVAEEMLRANEPGIPRQQLGPLLEAAHTMYTPDAIVGASEASRRLCDRLVAVSKADGPVLIRGERGSGKELVGRIVHYSSLATGPNLQVRCSSLSPESLENELFGYLRGAFPGAVADRPGLLHLARDGTLFLGEIADLPIDLQARILEVFEKGSVTRRGSNKRERIDTRIIASTSQDLESLASSGRFLPELLAKLTAGTLHVPPLRDRIEDLPILLDHVTERFGGQHAITGISADARWVMAQYDWPGNIAELEDCVEQACARANAGEIGVKHLTRPLRELALELPDRDIIPAMRPVTQPAALAASSGGATAVVVPTLRSYEPAHEWEITADDPISLELYEKKALLRALDSCGGDKLAAAKLLNVGKSTLYRKLKRFDIK